MVRNKSTIDHLPLALLLALTGTLGFLKLHLPQLGNLNLAENKEEIS